MKKLNLLVLAIVCFLMLMTTAYGSSLIEKHANWILEQNDEVSQKFALDVAKYIFENCDHPQLVISIISEESKFDPKASRKDTKVYGLGQIKFSVWKKELVQFKIYRPKDLHDWRKNILAMNYIVEKYYDQSNKNVNKTILKYLGGAKKSNAKYRVKVNKNMLTLNKIKGGSVNRG